MDPLWCHFFFSISKGKAKHDKIMKQASMIFAQCLHKMGCVLSDTVFCQMFLLVFFFSIMTCLLLYMTITKWSGNPQKCSLYLYPLHSSLSLKTACHSENNSSISCIPTLYVFISSLPLNLCCFMLTCSLGLFIIIFTYIFDILLHAHYNVCKQNNSWFSADVISLCKLGFPHVGAHARCEIVSNCEKICALTIKVFK